MRYAVAAQWADLVTFVGMIAIAGPSAEANPIIRAALASGLLALILAAKVALIVALAAWQRAVGRGTRPVQLAGVLVGAIGFASNLRAVA
jgi:hypothetical protein